MPLAMEGIVLLTQSPRQQTLIRGECGMGWGKFISIL